MTESLLNIPTLLAALGCGLVAGTLLAFSTFIMKALARLPAPQGIAAMQFINVVVIPPVFLWVFVGTAAVCAWLAVSAAFTWNGIDAISRLVGGLLYLFGTFVVTIAFNVPRNNVLAAVDPASADGARLWAEYVAAWTAWNHVRTRPRIPRSEHCFAEGAPGPWLAPLK